MDSETSASLIHIGDCIFDRARGILLRSGDVVPVRAKTFALLDFLVANRGSVISKDDIMAAVWPDVFVSEDSLTQCIRDLRKALGDETQRWLKTVSRRGYLLDTGSSADSSLQKASLPAPADEPAVAILPFAVSDGVDPVLMDGIIEEITNGLARFRTVAVIARASAFTFPVAARPPPQVVGEKLRADHLVEGSFRRGKDGFRISVTLTHAPSGRQVWGEQFACAEEDLLDIDTVIARKIISRLVANIEDSVLRRIAGAPVTSLQAFEHLARARVLLRGYGAENNLAGRDHLLQALEIDPDFALAHAYLALAEMILADYGAASRAVLDQVVTRLQRALALAPEEARCYRIMALAQLYLREHGAAESYLTRALDLNPYDADTLAQMGFLAAMRGRPTEATTWVERAIALNPFRPAWYDSDLAFPLYDLGRYGETLEALATVPDRGPFEEARRAACHVLMGNRQRAAQHAANVLSAYTGDDLFAYLRISVEYEHERDVEHFLDGVRQALEAYREASQSPSSDSARSSAE